MPIIELPALRSDDALGFLAGLGLVEVCTTGLGLDVRLGWDGLGGAGLLVSEFLDTRELATAAHGLVSTWRAESRVAVPSNPTFIRPRLSDAERKERIRELGAKPPNDPMRMDRESARARFSEQRESELAGDRAGARWLAGLVAQLAIVEKGSSIPYCDLTPLYAPAGQQTLFQLYEKYANIVAASPRWVEEALTGWQRSDSDSGANLDYRDARDAAASSSGGSEYAGVPGTTWLALQSVPYFRLIGNGSQGGAVGWRTRRGSRPRTLHWPVWQPPLSPAAIGVLLDHPAVAVDDSEDLDPGCLHALGVTAVLQAQRRSMGNSDGPLQPPRVLWP